MYLNDMADAIRAAGLNVVEVGNWRARNHGSMAGVRSIVCHHTAGPLNGTYPSLNTVTNGRPGLAGPLAQLGLGRDGTVYVISNGVAWHAGATIDDSVYGNSWSIGIEAENNGVGEVWPAVQVDAYAKLCAALCRHYNIPVDRVKGHKEICRPAGRKIDPANLPGDMNGHRDRVRVKLQSPTKLVYVNGENEVKLPIAMNSETHGFSVPPQVRCRIVFSADTVIFGGVLKFWGDQPNKPTGKDYPPGWRCEVNQGYQIDVPAGTTKVQVNYSCASEVHVFIQGIA